MPAPEAGPGAMPVPLWGAVEPPAARALLEAGDEGELEGALEALVRAPAAEAAGAPAGGNAEGRAAVAKELLRNVVNFCKAEGFDAEKAAVALKVTADAHREVAMHHLNSLTSLDRLMDSLMKYSIQRPPISVGVFQLAEAQKLIAFLIGSYYKHFHMYQYVYRSNLEATLDQVGPIELPSIPALPALATARLAAEVEAEKATAEQAAREQAAKEEAEKRAAAEPKPPSPEEVAAAEAALSPELLALVQGHLEKEMDRLKQELPVSKELQDAQARLEALAAG